MTSVATPIWNEIARTQRLETSWARKAFALDPDQMADLESQEYHDLLAKGLEHAVAASLLDVKPLLLKKRAISRYTQFHPELRAALPEICSVTEAVILAS